MKYLLLLFLPSLAYAEANLPLTTFKTVPFHNSFYVTSDANSEEHLSINLGAFYIYENRPLRVVEKGSLDTVTDLIKSRHNLDLMVSLGLFNRIDLGAVLPFTMHQHSLGQNFLGRKQDTVYSGGLGDLRLYSKVRFFTKSWFSMGALLGVALPTSDDALLREKKGTWINPSLLFSARTSYVDVSLNAGYRFRVSDETFHMGPSFVLQSITVDDEFTASLGAKGHVWKNKLDLVGDFFLSVQTKETGREEVPAELVGGLRVYLPFNMVANLGGGAALTRGAGSARFRTFVGLSWSPPPKKVVTHEVTETVTTIVVEKEVESKKVCPTIPRVERDYVAIPPVFFTTNSVTILPRSIPLLKMAVNIINRNPWIKKVVLEGHADSRGKVKYNQKLSERRARAVFKYLTSNGVDEKRLQFVGFGEDKPSVPNKNKSGMTQNRRVEFELNR